MSRYIPVRRPAHLPDQLTITLWDFSWYVRSGPGEPFEDLDRALAEAVDRGYNTIRICAMPFLLFGSGLDTANLRLDRLGGDYAMRMRWYDVGRPTVIDARAQLLALFRAAQRHDCYVIISSWEYQQSSSFAATSDWCDALLAVDLADRPAALARAEADLVDFLISEGVDDRIAFVEIHNEVVTGHLSDQVGDQDQAVIEIRPRLEHAVDLFHERHPGVMCTVNYAGVPVGAMRGICENIDVLVTHPYVYGVLDAFIQTFRLRRPVEEFDQQRAAEILLPNAPEITDWNVPAGQQWKHRATIVSRSEVYVHDWGDAAAIDRWLYDHWAAYREQMIARLQLWMGAAADWAAAHDVPTVFGEGWIGYTPADCRFEEGPVGAEFCRLAMRESARVGAWGTIVCSNAAPQHAMWDDVALQVECNNLFRSAHRP